MSELEQKRKKSEKSGIQVVARSAATLITLLIARSAAILRTLRAHPDGVNLGQIAANVDLPRSTVQRIVVHCRLSASRS